MPKIRMSALVSQAAEADENQERPATSNDTEPEAANPPKIIPMMMTVADLAAELQVSEKTVRRFDVEGKIPEPNRVGRLLRWPRQMIIEWIAAGSPQRGQWHWRPRRTSS